MQCKSLKLERVTFFIVFLLAKPNLLTFFKNLKSATCSVGVIDHKKSTKMWLADLQGLCIFRLPKWFLIMFSD